jgi:glycerol-3-phosphate cytidylyltransferase
MNTKSIVYTTGTFDVIHQGHINILKIAKSLGDILIVGVSTDEVVEEYKPSKLIHAYETRKLIVESLKFVDICIPQRSRDKFEAWKRLKFDILVVGDDWYDQPNFKQYESQLNEVGVKIIYIPYYQGISSTIVRQRISESKNG